MSNISPLAGKPAPESILINVQQLISAYYEEIPDPSIPKQRVVFGTSGHRGCSYDKSFNEWHILAITQAICLYRKQSNINGPLFLGIDTHALSMPAYASAMEVLAANGVEVMIAKNEEYTPTPVISHAILAYNQDRATGLADGIVVTPSHDPPHDGGFKYNPPNGGPADHTITDWIEKKSNAILESQLEDVKRLAFNQALRAPTTHEHDFMNAYIDDLKNVIDMAIIRDSKIHMGVDPLGGAGVHYWPVIAERYGLDLTIVNNKVDPTFSFMTVDWDGQIRMDPSSPYAMEGLIALKDRFDIAFACDTDHDRHGIVTREAGLLTPNHYLCIAISYLIQNRPQWNTSAKIGKTIVSSEMINRITKKLDRLIYEVPVGFKWFSQGLLDGTLKFCGEESAGSSFSRLNGRVWTTDKDGIILALLAGEITARTKRDPSAIYSDLEQTLGKSYFKRIDARATLTQRQVLKNLDQQQIKATQLAGENIERILTHAPGNDAPIGGVKVCCENGWFAARPSGTEDIYRIYAESFKGDEHLTHILTDAQIMISDILKRIDPD